MSAPVADFWNPTGCPRRASARHPAPPPGRAPHARAATAPHTGTSFRRPSSAGSSPCRSPVATSAGPTGTRRRPREPRLLIPTRGTELSWVCSAAARAVSRSTAPGTRRPGWRRDPAAASGCGVPSPITRTDPAVGRRCPSAAADAACPSRCWSRPAPWAAYGRCGASCADDEARCVPATPDDVCPAIGAPNATTTAQLFVGSAGASTDARRRGSTRRDLPTGGTCTEGSRAASHSHLLIDISSNGDSVG